MAHEHSPSTVTEFDYPSFGLDRCYTAAQLQRAAERKPYLEALQAPVPLVMKARPPIEVPMSDVASTSAPQSRSDTSGSAATSAGPTT